MTAVAHSKVHTSLSMEIERVTGLLTGGNSESFPDSATATADNRFLEYITNTVGIPTGLVGQFLQHPLFQQDTYPAVRPIPTTALATHRKNFLREIFSPDGYCWPVAGQEAGTARFRRLKR